MLPRKYRLPLRTELNRVKERGNLFQGKLFSLLVEKRKDKKPSRFSFIVSTKIHKRATKRNRARRLLTEAIRPFLSEISPSFDVVFLTKKAIIGKRSVEIKKELQELFKKVKLI